MIRFKKVWWKAARDWIGAIQNLRPSAIPATGFPDIDGLGFKERMAVEFVGVPVGGLFVVNGGEERHSDRVDNEFIYAFVGWLCGFAHTEGFGYLYVLGCLDLKITMVCSF